MGGRKMEKGYLQSSRFVIEKGAKTPPIDEGLIKVSVG